MKLLLDSHVLVWCLECPGELIPGIQDTITAPDNQVFFSAASIWELAIKMAKGKLRLPADFVRELEATGFDPLPVRIEHALAVREIPDGPHADPFDRLLISQARIEGLALVTRDSHLKAYGVTILEA